VTRFVVGAEGKHIVTDCLVEDVAVYWVRSGVLGEVMPSCCWSLCGPLITAPNVTSSACVIAKNSTLMLSACVQ